MLFYLGVILGATFLAVLAELTKKKRKLSALFWICSAIIMFIPLAMREVGVDYQNYVNIYESIVSLGWKGHWNQNVIRHEPLYEILNFVAYWLFDDFQGVNILCALLSVGISYYAIDQYRDKINLGISVWCFGFIYYIMMYGLNRMMIAVAIYTLSYKYYINKNFKKYILCCSIAGLFHYSAFLMIPFYFVMTCFEKKGTRRQLLKKINTIWLITVMFISLYTLIPIIFNRFSWFGRYKGYFIFDINIKTLNNNAALYMLTLLIFVFNHQLRRYLEKYENLIMVFYIGIILALISTILPLHRLCYFIYPCGVILYALVPNALTAYDYSTGGEKRKWMTLVYSVVLFLMGGLWIYKFIVLESLWAPFINPYIGIF